MSAWSRGGAGIGAWACVFAVVVACGTDDTADRGGVGGALSGSGAAGSGPTGASGATSNGTGGAAGSSATSGAAGNGGAGISGASGSAGAAGNGGSAGAAGSGGKGAGGSVDGGAAGNGGAGGRGGTAGNGGAAGSGGAAGVPGDAGSTTIKHFVTFYGWPDNDPPGNGIALPVIHHNGAAGIGSYADPITFASSPQEWPKGTILYVPYLKRYVIMEDTCAQCITDWGTHKYHIDIWVNSNGTMDPQAIACENSLTRTSTDVEVSPPADRPVDTRPLLDPTTGQCITP